MGVPALRREPTPARARTPRLAVVRPAVKRSSRACSPAARVEAARSAFRTFALLALVVSVLGIGRVWLSVQAAEASMEASRLRTDIKSERYEGDMLEVRQSALGSPSRIRAIAGEAMKMAPARKVTYLDLQAPTRATAVSVSESGRPVSEPAPAGIGALIANVMDLTAGEAQVLLVGDVGLSAAR